MEHEREFPISKLDELFRSALTIDDDIKVVDVERGPDSSDPTDPSLPPQVYVAHVGEVYVALDMRALEVAAWNTGDFEVRRPPACAFGYVSFRTGMDGVVYDADTDTLLITADSYWNDIKPVYAHDLYVALRAKRIYDPIEQRYPRADASLYPATWTERLLEMTSAPPTMGADRIVPRLVSCLSPNCKIALDYAQPTIAAVGKGTFDVLWEDDGKKDKRQFDVVVVDPLASPGAELQTATRTLVIGSLSEMRGAISRSLHGWLFRAVREFRVRTRPIPEPPKPLVDFVREQTPESIDYEKLAPSGKWGTGPRIPETRKRSLQWLRRKGRRLVLAADAPSDLKTFKNTSEPMVVVATYGKRNEFVLAIDTGTREMCVKTTRTDLPSDSFLSVRDWSAALHVTSYGKRHRYSKKDPEHYTLAATGEWLPLVINGGYGGEGMAQVLVETLYEAMVCGQIHYRPLSADDSDDDDNNDGSGGVPLTPLEQFAKDFAAGLRIITYPTERTRPKRVKSDEEADVVDDVYVTRMALWGSAWQSIGKTDACYTFGDGGTRCALQITARGQGALWDPAELTLTLTPSALENNVVPLFFANEPSAAHFSDWLQIFFANKEALVKAMIAYTMGVPQTHANAAVFIH